EREFAENYRSAGGAAPFESYLSRAYDRISVKEALRRNVVFFQHDLVSDQAFGEMHVIFCRNVFIYFSPDLRKRVLAKFRQALRELLKPELALMLLDIQMPDMDGYEVARYARANPATRDVPILFLTATHETEESKLRGYGSGAVDFLFKPINSIVLRSKVRV